MIDRHSPAQGDYEELRALLTQGVEAVLATWNDGDPPVYRRATPETFFWENDPFGDGFPPVYYFCR